MFSRQPDALTWFGNGAGGPLLAVEQPWVAAALKARAPQTWLWLGPVTMDLSMNASPRGVQLHRQPPGFSGSVRCDLPLPLPTEAIGAVVLQHALETGRDDLLEECARVLEPGGRLWLFALNPWSPYRARWHGLDLVIHDAVGWRERLRATGLQLVGREICYLGPVWRAKSGTGGRAPDRLRAVCLLEAEKRVAALIPPSPVKRPWRTDAAPA
jgi:SAM-dependent methyltransferase